MLRLDATQSDFEARFLELLDMKRENDADVNAAVAAIIADVRKRGDDALIEYTKKFDRLSALSADSVGLKLNSVLSKPMAAE